MRYHRLLRTRLTPGTQPGARAARSATQRTGTVSKRDKQGNGTAKGDEVRVDAIEDRGQGKRLDARRR